MQVSTDDGILWICCNILLNTAKNIAKQKTNVKLSSTKSVKIKKETN